MSQKLEYTGKNSTTENWRLDEKTYSAKDGVVTVNDDHVAPLLLTTVWKQVDPSLPIPESSFVAQPHVKSGANRSASQPQVETKTATATEDKTDGRTGGSAAEPKKDNR